VKNALECIDAVKVVILTHEIVWILEAKKLELEGG
jgi:hypothetical protein